MRVFTRCYLQTDSYQAPINNSLRVTLINSLETIWKISSQLFIDLEDSSTPYYLL